LKIEITVPVLNEEQTLEEQICKLSNFLELDMPSNYDYSICVADNGSTDETLAIASRLQSVIPELRIVRRPKPGVGGALKESWMTSDADIVGYMDLDFSTPLRYLHSVVDTFQDEDVVLVAASRLLPQSKVIGRRPIRSVTSRAFNFIVRRGFQVPITDGMCGFKFIRKTSLETVLNGGAQSDGWFFATELLVVGHYEHLKIIEIPVEWVDDPNSKVRLLKLTLTYLRDLKLLRSRLAARKDKGS
jgi:glycosyltransferase involved in cell wall biosynthesis